MIANEKGLQVGSISDDNADHYKYRQYVTTRLEVNIDESSLALKITTAYSTIAKTTVHVIIATFPPHPYPENSIY